jgi:4-oxalomesaconate tautomerase
VATACLLPGSVAQQVCGLETKSGVQRLDVEHPTGFFSVDVEVVAAGESITVKRTALLRTTRALMRGEVLVPATVWSGP